MEIYKIIKVEWKDITFYSGQYSVKDIEDYGFKKFSSVGFLISENKERVVLSMSAETTEEDNIADCLFIPKVNILKRETIELIKEVVK